MSQLKQQANKGKSSVLNHLLQLGISKRLKARKPSFCLSFPQVDLLRTLSWGGGWRSRQEWKALGTESKNATENVKNLTAPKPQTLRKLSSETEMQELCPKSRVGKAALACKTWLAKSL